MTMETIIKAIDKIEVKLNSQLPELADRVLTLEQRGVMHGKGSAGARARQGIGAMVWDEVQKNADLLAKTGSLRLVVKAAADAITTANGRNLVVGEVGGISGGVLGLQNYLPSMPAGGVTAIEYSRYTGKQGAAAQQTAEGAAKAYVRPDHSLITQKALTVAGLTKVSKQAMTDRAELIAAIEATLMREVSLTADVVLCNGGTDFVGGFEALATASTSLLYTALPDAIAEGVAAMQVAGFAPDLVMLNPNDWLAVTVAKGTDGHYLSGAYLGAMPMEMRTLRVGLSPSVDAGKALVLDSLHTELKIVEDFNIEIAYVNDDFEKNLATMRGEARIIPVFRTAGAGRMITPKP